MLKKSATDSLKTAFKKNNSKTVDATNDLIVNKIKNKFIKSVPGASGQNNLETFLDKTYDIRFDAKMPKERHILPEKRQKIINELGLI